MHSFCCSSVQRQDMGGMFMLESPCRGCSGSQTQANAGDSRSVLGVKGRAKPLSFDHKPQNEGKIREAASD